MARPSLGVVTLIVRVLLTDVPLHISPPPQVYASFIAITTAATNWAILAFSTALGGLGTGDCDRSVDVDGIVAELAVACAPENLFAVLGATTAVVVLSGAVFLQSVKRKQVGSFFKPMSYRQQAALNFTSNHTEQHKIELITSRDPVYWPKEAVRDFIAAHRVGWEADPPAWFADPRWKAALPKDCWPDSPVAGEDV